MCCRKTLPWVLQPVWNSGVFTHLHERRGTAATGSLGYAPFAEGNGLDGCLSFLPPSLDTSLIIMKISPELLWVSLCLAEVLLLLQLGVQELTWCRRHPSCQFSCCCLLLWDPDFIYFMFSLLHVFRWQMCAFLNLFLITLWNCGCVLTAFRQG